MQQDFKAACWTPCLMLAALAEMEHQMDAIPREECLKTAEAELEKMFKNVKNLSSNDLLEINIKIDVAGTMFAMKLADIQDMLQKFIDSKGNGGDMNVM